MPYKLTPLEDNVIVKPKRDEKNLEAEKRGIVITQELKNKEKPQQGTVIAVGRGIFEDGHFVELDLKPGDEVLFQKHAGQPFATGEEVVLILQYHDIIAKVEKYAGENKPDA